MKTIRQVNIKNRQHYFVNSMTNIKNFDSSMILLKYSYEICIKYDSYEILILAQYRSNIIRKY